MDIWYKCNYCGKEYPVKKLIRFWEEAPMYLPDICQSCGKGKFVKIRK